ncbi:hypothetical protein NE857_13175 [Nocardiopsis exhalans]|uniref:Uncharacterized protein n=1 Tax=Nocardiopsis exhalans TaxID=163604 RepID=A0ABY5DG63_9ACTN|nr:hypothetical protein [Nocardiopsis exhalans]USY22473.1 hypothetical protein NE857_13175 [Nocardiopsis exhalans]
MDTEVVQERGPRLGRWAAVGVGVLALATTGAGNPPMEVDPWETLEYEGSGDTVLMVDQHDDPRIATVTYDGERHFSVWAVDPRGENQDLLVNTTGRYEGTVLYNVLVGEELAALDISATGPWRIELKPLADTDEWGEGEDSYSGTGDDVVWLMWEPEGFSVLDISHSGERHFSVWAYADQDRDLLVNTRGDYEGQARLPAGSFLLEISAEGDWRIDR